MDVPFLSRVRRKWPHVLAVALVITNGLLIVATSHARQNADPKGPIDAGTSTLPSKAPRPKLLPTTERIVKETSAETIEESIDHLDSVLDWALASAPSANVRVFAESYENARIVAKLNRVRKLLAQIDDAKKEQYARIMLQKLKVCNEGYVESRKEFFAELNRRRGILVTSNCPYEQKRSQATALVYLLTEMERTEAIPVFADLLERREPIPVNRLFLIYSCHLLLEACPTDGLSATQSERLRAYHDVADKSLPIEERKTVTAWNAKYNESDFRAVSLGRTFQLTRNQPSNSAPIQS